MNNIESIKESAKPEMDIDKCVQEIGYEVLRQLDLWGCGFDDKNTANDWVAYICNYVANGAYSGRQSQYTPERFKEHLKKAAALCVSAILAIDRNGDCAPRHYEGLPRAGAKA